jgi:dTDP-glucose 4,6-dehydratase
MYNIGSENEWTNIDLVTKLCETVAKKKNKPRGYYKKLITYVNDRPGHDRRYTINCDKIKKELGWKQSVTFAEGLDRTVSWYLSNPAWIDHVKSGTYRQWINQNYKAR